MTSQSHGSVSQPTHPAQAARLEMSVILPVPQEADIIRAVISLYADELRPYSRILKKRLAEHAGFKESEAKDFDSERLRVMCEANVNLNVRSEEGGEWSVELIGEEPTFVDIYDEIDIYTDETWLAAESYFRALEQNPNCTLPGGRYATALELAQRRLPFLAGFTLGRICHFTQIATSKRKLLGYANGRIVPYASSLSVVKAQCAERQFPHVASSVDLPALPIADWNAARATLQDILATATMQDSLSVPLSNIKRIFRSLHRLELSETALGHGKLTDLLRDEKFHDVCTIQLQDRGYVVVPAREAPAGAGAAAHPVLGDLTCKGQPLDLASGLNSCKTPEPAAPVQRTVVSAIDSMQLFCPDEPLCLEDVDNCPMKEVSPTTAPFPFPTPSPEYVYSDCMRGSIYDWGLVGQSFGMALPARHNCEANLSKATQATEDSVSVPRRSFCPDEPLDLEAAHQEAQKAWMSPAPCAAWTPSPHYTTRSFRSYRLACADTAAGSGTAQNQSRSTSAESRPSVLLSESHGNSSRSDSSSESDHCTGYQNSHSAWPPQQFAYRNNCQFSSIVFNHEPSGHACQDDQHVAWPVRQPASSKIQQLEAIPLLGPPLPGIHAQPFTVSQTLPEGFNASCAASASAHGPDDLTATGLADAINLGSEAHLAGTCRPCAHFHSSKGCKSALLCLFCHSCPPGELKRRQKAKKRFLKA